MIDTLKTELPVQDQTVIAEFPLSTTQMRCWFLDQLEPGNPSLNVAVRWELRGKLQTQSLERAFQTVIDRHEILRTRFVERDGAPVQQVLGAVTFKLDRIDLSAIDPADQGQRIEEIAHENAKRRFDLSQGGLIRATHVRLASDRAMILFVVHQSCFDGFSIKVLGREIGIAAQAYEAGQVPDLPELPLQYGDFTLWQAEYLASGVLEEESAYWLTNLANAPYFEIAPDKPRQAVKSTNAAAVTIDCPANFGPDLERISQRLGVSPFTFGAAIFAGCLGRINGCADVLFGTQIAGRLDSELDPLIGVFINNLVLRFKAEAQCSIADHVLQAKSVIEGALSHQAMPFNTLVERLNPPRDPSRTPMISVNFNLQSVFMESKTYGDFSLSSSQSHAPGAIYDLDLAVMSRPAGWQMNLEYASDLFDAATAQSIVDMMAGAFALAFADEAAALGQIALPPDLETRGQADRQTCAALEHALLGHKMVAEAIVLNDGDVFYGFVVPGDTGTLPLEGLSQKILDAVSGPVLPAQLLGLSLLGSLPRTAQGDVNKAVLKVPAQVSTPHKTGTIDPDVMAQLKQDWVEILNLSSIPADASFFDLGGHSVLVLRQLARIRKRWSVALDVTAIYENASLTELARLVSGRIATPSEAPAKDWRFMTLSKTGEGQPLIAINNAATGLALATAGSHRREVHCARIVEADKSFDLEDQSFEQIAAAYADVIRAGQPQGPYLLYGNCVHGNLALETARHLHASGAEIAAVVMKDVWEPGYTEALLADPKTRRREKRHMLRMRLRELRNGEMSLGTFLRYYSLARRSGLLALGTKLGLFERRHNSDLSLHQERFISQISAKRDIYRPKPVRFPVLHVVTDTTPQGAGFQPSIGWEDVVEGEFLRTVKLKKVLIEQDRRIGIDVMAREIEVFLTERASPD